MTLPRTAHVAAASLNQTVGDWQGNTARVRRAMDEARRRGARLLALPEMCLSGYDLGDRLLMPGTLDRSWGALEALLPDTHGLVTCVGLPIRHRGVVYDAVAVVANGRIWGLVAKENLATGDVQYENRWFAAWPRAGVEEFTCPDGTTLPLGALMFDGEGLGTFAIEICEDGWKGLRPGSVYALAGAQILVNPSASWFTIGKHRLRRRLVEQISSEDHVAYLYCSLHGCDATRLVFDGSTFVAQGGEVLAEGRRFRFGDDLELVDARVDLEALRFSRREEGSWRQQVEALTRGTYGPMPPTVRIDGDFSTPASAPAGDPYWMRELRTRAPDPSLAWLVEEGLVARAPGTADLPHLELELALCTGLREYLRKCGVPGLALALSGGRDSTMCALLVHRMYRYDRPDLDPDALRAHVGERFATCYLASEHSSVATREAAAAVAREVGASHHEVGMQEAVDLHLDLVARMTGTRLSWSDPAHDLPLQNVQARIRSALVWTVANLHGYLLLATSNKSEAAVGYTTMDGDTSGGLAPIADVPKSLVGLWLAWARDVHGYASVDRVLGTPATAELRPADRAQRDEDDLMPFYVLDQLMEQFVQRGKDPLEIFHALWPRLQDHYAGDARAFAAHVRKFVRMLCSAQWKRERYAIGIRVTAFDLDPKTGFRFPPVQAPFEEELAELDAWVATL